MPSTFRDGSPRDGPSGHGRIAAAVERLTERRVRGFMSANHAQPDLAAEIFVLDGAIRIKEVAAEGS
jgi:hypothetical protein